MKLPFYETGLIIKNPVTQKDIDSTIALIDKLKPHQIYAAGDLADPHGTHRVCLEIIFAAVEKLKAKSYMKDCWMWLYSGAWHEWQIHEIDMAVPMSPDQVLRKRKAIFYHQSQKDVFKIMEKKLYYFIMMPAMLLSWLFGILLIHSLGFPVFGELWMQIKIILVVIMTFYHFSLGKYLNDFAIDNNQKTSKFFRIYNEIPTLIIIVVIFVVVFKPL